LGKILSAILTFLTDILSLSFSVFPAAFVIIKNLDSQALARQLRIMAAGVWHNIVLALFAAFLLWTMPFILKPFYPQGRSVTVLGVLPDKALSNHTVNAFHQGIFIHMDDIKEHSR
jgi:hypothetical protein